MRLDGGRNEERPAFHLQVRLLAAPEGMLALASQSWSGVGGCSLLPLFHSPAEP